MIPNFSFRWASPPSYLKSGLVYEELDINIVQAGEDHVAGVHLVVVPPAHIVRFLPFFTRKVAEVWAYAINYGKSGRDSGLRGKSWPP